MLEFGIDTSDGKYGITCRHTWDIKMLLSVVTRLLRQSTFIRHPYVSRVAEFSRYIPSGHKAPRYDDVRWHSERVACYMAVFRDHRDVFSVIHLIYARTLLWDGYYNEINDTLCKIYSQKLKCQNFVNLNKFKVFIVHMRGNNIIMSTLHKLKKIFSMIDMINIINIINI